jgi:hypothetical protein
MFELIIELLLYLSELLRLQGIEVDCIADKSVVECVIFWRDKKSLLCSCFPDILEVLPVDLVQVVAGVVN